MEKKVKIKNLYNLPLKDYNFLYDFDNEFFEKEYPVMWKNVAFYVENNYANEVKKIYTEMENRVLKEWESSGYKNIDALKSLIHYKELMIFWKKLEKAKELMRTNIKKYGGLILKEESYITTKKEIEELNKIALEKANKAYITKIEGRWLQITIDEKKKRTTFKYKDWETYTINLWMTSTYRTNLYPREIEIINNCIEAWLFYEYIWAIFWRNEKSIWRAIKEQLWATNVFLTPKKDYKKLPMIKVLDHTWFFVIEKESQLYNKLNKKTD